MYNLEKYEMRCAAATAIGVAGLAMSGYQMYQGQKEQKGRQKTLCVIMSVKI